MGLLEGVLKARSNIKKDLPARSKKVSKDATSQAAKDQHTRNDELPCIRTVQSKVQNSSEDKTAAQDLDCQAHRPLLSASEHADLPTHKSAELAQEHTVAVKPPVSFYSGWQTRNVDKAILRLLHHVKEKMRLGAFAPPFQHFPLQEPALRFADSHDLADELRIFSVERSETGKRSFIATTYDEFWRRYQDMLPLHRHHYEIIREGTPCKLYFDLEFKPNLNPGRCGQELVDYVINMSTIKLQEKFGIELSKEDWLELDSSTDVKFSRHLILVAPSFCFKSNLHVGAFVEELIKESQNDAEAPETKSPLIMEDSEGKVACFIDNGVYTKNRAFRLMLSSKAGKTAILTPTGRLRPFQTNRLTFFESLIGNTLSSARMLTCFEGDTAPGRRTFNGSSRRESTTCSGGQGQPSPFPAVDAFITSICQQDGQAGWIRSWAWTETERILLLNIAGTRYCSNVGRQHKSNGIYYIVDLQESVWYQKCYDPDCRRYRSAIMPLPPECITPAQQQGHLEETWPADDMDEHP